MHLNPHAKCRSSKFNLELFKKNGVTYNLETHSLASMLPMKRELVANLYLLLTVSWVGLQSVIVAFPSFFFVYAIMAYWYMYRNRCEHACKHDTCM